MRSKPLLVRGTVMRTGAFGALVDAYEMYCSVSGLLNNNSDIGLYRIYIPSGVTSLLVNVYASATLAADATVMIRIIASGGGSVDFPSLPNAIAWQVETAMAGVVAGWNNITVNARVGNLANARAITCRGISIRPNV
jgi:hypothetical protein